jgi:hypothetical protein
LAAGWWWEQVDYQDNQDGQDLNEVDELFPPKTEDIPVMYTLIISKWTDDVNMIVMFIYFAFYFCLYLLMVEGDKLDTRGIALFINIDSDEHILTDHHQY